MSWASSTTGVAKTANPTFSDYTIDVKRFYSFNVFTFLTLFCIFFQSMDYTKRDSY